MHHNYIVVLNEKIGDSSVSTIIKAIMMGNVDNITAYKVSIESK